MGGFSSNNLKSAIWNYDPKTDLYRWVAGRVNDTQSIHLEYGEFGAQDPDAFFGLPLLASSVIDHNDNIWIYGNYYAPQNLFWMFNTTSYQFTYLGFDNVSNPITGEKGTPAPNNYPGRFNGAAMLVDSQNNLWLVGSAWFRTYNHVWHFNTTSLQWTWMWGDFDNGPADFTNKIWNGRWMPSATIDNDDRIWIFGGYNLPVSGHFGNWGDLWSFDKTLEWRVEWGDESSFMTNGSVAVPNEFNVGNYPSARNGAISVDRKDGTILVGMVGNRFVEDPLLLNDFWLFNKTSKLWKLVYGNVVNPVPTVFSHYRTEGSVLGGRAYPGGVSDIHSRGNLILFGGQVGNGELSDVWIIPQDQCLFAECSVNAQCVTVDYFWTNCTCKEGYFGDGKTCTASPVAPTVPSGSPSSNSPATPKSATSGTNTVVASILFCLLMAFVI